MTYIPSSHFPVGCVGAFLKTFTNTPTLPDGYVECNGQILSDSQSVYDGVEIPNLNGNSGGTQRFIRCSTVSGGTGGNETHRHQLYTIMWNDLAGVAFIFPSLNSIYSDYTSGAGGSSALVTYYEVVFVMRVR